ncbi:MAG: TonB-dependent receptor plug domain-containing protein [Dysgonomonas sp.]
MNKKFIRNPKAYRFKRFARKAYSAFNSMHKVVNIGVVTGCMLTFAHSTPTTAQDLLSKSDQFKIEEQELDEVTVTASRIEMPLNQTAKLVTIITKQEIEQAPVKSIQDLLVYAANVDVIQRGGNGVQADISIRGGSSDQTAILLNGINLSNSQTGHYSFDIPINLSDIERIEIIQGPSSLIYGAAAFSGGINIITKKKADNRLYARLEGGMHKLFNGEMKGALETGIATNQLSFGYNTSGGYIANSDYDLYNALWQTRLNINKLSKIDIQLGYNNKHYGANTFYSAAYPNQYEKTDTYLGSAKGEFGSTLKIIPNIYWTKHNDQFDLIKGSDKGRHYHRNDMYGGALNLHYKSLLGTTTFSGELRKEEILSSKLGKDVNKYHGKHYTQYDSRTSTSFVLEQNAVIRKFILSAGVLLNHNTLLDEWRYYPSVSASYNPLDNLKIYTSWGKGTRMPSFTDLYYTTETHNGNEGLKPERSESLDLGFKYSNGFVSAYLTGYLMRGRNMIDWVRETSKDKWSSWNHTELNKQGFDLGVNFRLKDILPVLGNNSSLSLDYSYIHQDRNETGLQSKYALNYLKDKFTTKFNHQIYKGLSANWHFRFQKRTGTYVEYKTEKTKTFPAFSTLDLKINYSYRNFNFYADLNNIYDTYYYDLGDIPQAGFWFSGGISYTLK